MPKGKIILVPFPFDDLSGTKVRPALCLTELIGPYKHIIIAFITSKIPADLLDSDLVLNDQHEDFSQTGLQKISTLRLHRLATITELLIKRELGTLPETWQVEVNRKLGRLLNIGNS